MAAMKNDEESHGVAKKIVEMSKTEGMANGEENVIMKENQAK